MIVVPNKELVLIESDSPKIITSSIPTARELVVGDKTYVAVPHKLDEIRVLHNLGHKVPSPVSHYYKWSGSYTPFEAQLKTVDFLTLNSRAFCLNDMGCVDSETEYLSPTGWVKISAYAGGDVAQYLPETKSIEFVRPDKYVKLPCENMLHLKNARGLNQMLSPEHRVILAERRSSRVEVIQAQSLYERQQAWLKGDTPKKVGKIGWSKAAIPVTFEYAGGSGLDLDVDELRLQVAVIADGHFPNKTNRCRVNIKKARKIVRLSTLLHSAGVKFTRIDKTDGFAEFNFHAPTREKDFSQWWGASAEQLEVIADEVLRWDGHVKGARREFHSRVKASADFVQFVFAQAGYTSRVLEQFRGDKADYVVSIRSDGEPLQVASHNGVGDKRPTITPCKSTDGFKYCFMVPSTYLIFRRNGCVFASGNTGKSLTSLWAFDYLRTIGKAKKLLVIAPLSTLERTWADEVFEHFNHLQAVVLHGSRDRRKKLLAMDADIYLINHDGLSVIKDDLVLRKDIDTVVVDEIATFRNASTTRWKCLNAVIKDRARVWGLTGTPTPNAPTDAWAQCRLICPENVTPFFTKFRSQTMRQVSPFKWQAKEGALDYVTEIMQPAIRFTRDSCVDLPPVMYENRLVEMSSDQQKAYKTMMTDLKLTWDTQKMSAMNEAVKINKLLQIAAGVAYDSKGQEIYFGAPGKINELREIIAQAGGKVIVFVVHRAALEYVNSDLSKDFNVGLIHGGVPKNKRDTVFSEFQKGTSLNIIVAQPGTMSHGLTLTAGNTIVWYSPAPGPEVYVQANARITRPGQKLSQYIINLESCPLEKRAYARLKAKQSTQGLLLEQLESYR